ALPILDRLVGVVQHQCEQADVGLEDPDHLVELASELAVEGDAGSDHNRADAGLVLDPTQLDRKLVDTGGVTEPVPARMLVEGSDQDLFVGHVLDENHSVVGSDLVDLSDLTVDNDTFGEGPLNLSLPHLGKLGEVQLTGEQGAADGVAGTVPVLRVAGAWVPTFDQGNPLLIVGQNRPNVETVGCGVENRPWDQKIDLAVVHVRSEEHTSELQSRENLVCR